MCANLETTSTRRAGRALHEVALVLVTTFAIVGAGAGSSIAHAAPPPPIQTPLAAQPKPVTYIVVPGDTLMKIAAEKGLDPETGWRHLYDANPVIADPDFIKPGQQLRVPAPGERVPPRPLPARAPQVAVGGPSSSVRQVSGGGVWDRLAQCESGGNWSSNVGTFDGGLQFHPGTWRAYGGTQYAPSANQATRDQQIAIAERVLAGQGWRAWPACSRKLGLR